MKMRLRFGERPAGKQSREPVEREVVRTRCKTNGRAISAPLVVLWLPRQPSADRIEEHVTKRDDELNVVLDQHGLVWAAKQVADSPVTPVRIPGVAGFQPLHKIRKVGVRSRHDFV